MMKKLSLIAGFGAGYVLGAKAGTQRYNEIVAKAREIAGMQAVQQATTAVKENAQPLLDSAKDTVNEKVASAKGDKSSDVVDLGASGSGAATRPPVSTTTRPATTTTAAAGAAPSVTAPVKRP